MSVVTYTYICSRSDTENGNRHFGVFQLNFYDNLFGPRYESAIMTYQKLTKDTVQTLLNEIFSADR